MTAMLEPSFHATAEPRWGPDILWNSVFPCSSQRNPPEKPNLGLFREQFSHCCYQQFLLPVWQGDQSTPREQGGAKERAERVSGKKAKLVP